MLERGGTAFDAAVAAAFLLHIALPEFSGIGGEVVMLVKRPGLDGPLVICGQGVAPAAASIEAFSHRGLTAIPERGLLAATTPGAFDAWMLLARDYGRLPLRDLLAPAIGYALSGTPTTALFRHQMARLEPFFQTEWPSSAAALAHFQPDADGMGNRNPAYAEMLQRILAEAEAGRCDRMAQIEKARDVFRRGFVADAIDRFVRIPHASSAQGERHAGLLTGADLARWSASYEAPVTYRYGRYQVAKAGPWTQGPVFLQYLALLRHKGIEHAAATDPAFIHIVIEAAKLVFADRERFYGDPNFVDVPLDDLLSDDYSRHRAALIGEAATEAVQPGDVPGFRATEGRLPGDGAEEDDLERIMIRRSGHAPGATVSIAAADREGNMVAAVPSGGTVLESPIIPTLGLCLGARASGFRLSPDHANGLAPGKRPRTTLSPTLVMRDDQAFLACCTPGADQQEQWQIAFFLRIAHQAMNLQEAIDAPMFQSEHFPSSFPPFRSRPNRVAVEPRIGEAICGALRERGHRLVVTRQEWFLGGLTAVMQDNHVLKAAACPRFMRAYATGR